MEYGLRRYEATERLLWFLFFLVCLGIAYLMVPDHLPASHAGIPAPRTIQPEVMKSLDFWLNLRWISIDPLGKLMLFLVWALFLFLMGRFLGLFIQYAGKYAVKGFLAAHIRLNAGSLRTQTHPPNTPAPIFPEALLLQKTRNPFLQFLFHPFRRLRVLITNPGKTLSSGRLSEKERRLAEMDWEILWSSWTPFRWLLRLLPLAGTVQTVWLLYQVLQPALSGQKDFQELFGLVFNGLFPLFQVVFLTIAFSVAAGLLRRLESFYLSGVDALFYERFLTRLPFQSSDTPILLEMLQKNFQELHAGLKHLEEYIVPGRESESKKR